MHPDYDLQAKLCKAGMFPGCSGQAEACSIVMNKRGRSAMTSLWIAIEINCQQIAVLSDNFYGTLFFN